DYLASFLFISYFLLLGAYVDAHVTVARRRAAWLGKTTRAVTAATVLGASSDIATPPSVTSSPINAAPGPIAPVPTISPVSTADPRPVLAAPLLESKPG